MRSRSFFIVATLVVLLVAAAAGIYAYDSGREHQITKGITVGGVPVGGMKEAAARAKRRARRLYFGAMSRSQGLTKYMSVWPLFLALIFLA